jgi:hypothetical protein
MLSALLNSKRVSIYCIINEQDKKIYITYSIETIPSILYSINKIISELMYDKDKVEFRLIETYDSCSRLYLKWRVQELYEEYKNLGYSFYSSYKPLHWVLYVGVSKGTAKGIKDHYKAIVKLKTSSNKVYDIKVCNSIKEATDFVASNTISNIVRML